MTLKDILDKLSKTDRAVLNYSFEHSMVQYVQYEPGKFIGVHIKDSKYLTVEQSAGNWSSGTIKGTTYDT